MPLVAFSKNPESVPDYNVVKTVIDSTLKKMNLHVKLLSMQWKFNKKQNIQLSFNNVKKDIITDSKGNITLKLIPSKYKFQFFYSEYFLKLHLILSKAKKGIKHLYLYF